MKSNHAFKEHATLLNAPQLHPNTSSGAAQRSVPVNGRRIGLSDWGRGLGFRAGFENKITPLFKTMSGSCIVTYTDGIGASLREVCSILGAYTKQMIIMKMPHRDIVRFLPKYIIETRLRAAVIVNIISMEYAEV